MRVKINENTAHRQNRGLSLYHKYFRYYFDFYLPPHPTLVELQDSQGLYVRNDEIEAQLQAFYDHRQTFPQLLTGLTGIGKSTVICAFFDLWHDGGYRFAHP